MDLTVEEISQYRKLMLPVLNFREPTFVRGEGSYVWDSEGKKYLDLNSGQFCSVLGHSHKEVAELMFTVSENLQDTDTSSLSVPVLNAAKKMHDIAIGMDARVLFLSTGAEAVECALRYAKHIKEKPGVVSFSKAYHGQTHGSAAYSMSRKKIRPSVDYSYEVTTPNWFSTEDADQDFIVPYVEEFENLLKENIEFISAAIFEPIVSGGGFYFPPSNYFREIRKICDRYGVFLVFDECQTGMGRTGYWFYYQKLGVVPDFLITAKALGLGYPVSCVLVNGNTIKHHRFIMEHFSSHQNEPFAGYITSFLIKKIASDDILNQNKFKGQYLSSGLKKLSEKFPALNNVRGIGLMYAFDITYHGDSKQNGNKFCERAMMFGLLLQHCNLGKTIRLLPNYNASLRDIDDFLLCLHALLDSFQPEEML